MIDDSSYWELINLRHSPCAGNTVPDVDGFHVDNGEKELTRYLEARKKVK